MGGPQGRENGFLGGGQFFVRNLAIAAGCQLGEYLLTGHIFLVKIDTGRYGDDALGAMVTGADLVAQGHFLTDIHEQLAGHACAEDGIEQLHCRKFLMAIGDGGGKAHAQLALSHIHGFALVNGFGHMVAGLGR